MSDSFRRPGQTLVPEALLDDREVAVSKHQDSGLDLTPMRGNTRTPLASSFDPSELQSDVQAALAELEPHQPSELPAEFEEWALDDGPPTLDRHEVRRSLAAPSGLDPMMLVAAVVGLLVTVVIGMAVMAALASMGPTESMAPPAGVFSVE